MRFSTRLRLRARAMDCGDDRGMASLVMVIIIIGMGLAALMTPLVLLQSSTTSHTDFRVQALESAQSGLNTMIGRLRSGISAVNATSAATNLPCYPAATPLTASQPGSTSSAYSVSLAYSSSDPLQTPVISLSCTVGDPAGQVVNPLTGAVVNPSFARIRSVGTAGTGSRAVTRTLLATYSFANQDVYNSTTTSSAVAGGQIRFKPRVGAAQLLCIDAGAAPGVGSVLNLAVCGTPLTPSQQFTYTSDLTLQMANTISTAAPYGLCVTSRSPDTSVSLQPCPLAGQAGSDQQWSWTATTSFSQARPTSSSYCLTVATGSTTVTAKSCPAGYDDSVSWLPTPYAGTGSAGASMNQLVNLSEFGRCAQVTDGTVPSALPHPFLTLYPCEQSTTKANIDWFQQFSFDPATGHWSTTRTGDQVNYCLTSPGTEGGLVTVTACSADPSQKWVDNGASSAAQGNSSQYVAATRFTIVDSSSRCLSLTPTAGSGAKWYTLSGVQYSELTTDTCDTSARQKWNAPNPAAAIKDITEG